MKVFKIWMKDQAVQLLADYFRKEYNNPQMYMASNKEDRETMIQHYFGEADPDGTCDLVGGVIVEEVSE